MELSKHVLEDDLYQNVNVTGDMTNTAKNKNIHFLSHYSGYGHESWSLGSL